MSNLFYGPRLIKELVESKEGYEVKFVPGLAGRITMIVSEIESNKVVVHETANDEDEMVVNLGKAWAEVNDTGIEDSGI